MIDDHLMSKIIIESFVLHIGKEDKDGQCQTDQFNYRIRISLQMNDRRRRLNPEQLLAY